ncbi:MAG: hypothetical protein GX637_05425 [Clostridiales bacterium]|nr:hypothetical protein [Clostridiales bacterium]
MRRGRFLLAMAVLLAVLTLLGTMPGAEAPVEDARGAGEEAAEEPARPAGSDPEARVAAQCQVIQTMRFSRCGHSVSRRIQAPVEVIGGDFQAVQGYYDLWRIDSFTADLMEMSREIDLYCPMHLVLACNEAGEVVLTRNLYGDGMAIEKTFEGVTLEQFDEAARDALRLGLGFDTLEEAETWLAAH